MASLFLKAHVQSIVFLWRDDDPVIKQLVGALFLTAVFWPASAAPTAAPKPGTPTVGSTIKTHDAAVTLHEYRPVVNSRHPTETAPAGNEVTAIYVEICNTSTGALPVRRSQFFIETPDRHLVFPATTGNEPHPQLTTTRLAHGRCLRGWVSYFVPTGTRAAFAVFQAGAMLTPTLHRWTIPKA